MAIPFQAEVTINDYPADCAELVREALAAVFDEDTSGYAVSPVEPQFGIWLVEVPEAEERRILEDGYLIIDTGRHAITIEMP